jgi:hypothetical protein
MSEMKTYIRYTYTDPKNPKARRENRCQARPYVAGESMAEINIAMPDKEEGHPKVGDMIVKYPGEELPWLVAAENFRDIFVEA